MASLVSRAVDVVVYQAKNAENQRRVSEVVEVEGARSVDGAIEYLTRPTMS
jgi:Flp pilus assembly CpaF family ATPase